MRLLRYIAIQLKIAGRKCPAIFALSLVFLVGTLLLAFSIKTASILDEKQNKVSVALVGDSSEEYLGVGIGLMTQMDYSQYTMDFVETTESEAKKLLKHGDIKAYIVIPEGFIESFAYGDIKKLTFVMRDETDGYGIVLAKEFLQMVSDYVIATENAVFSTFDVAQDLLPYSEIMSATDRLMLEEATLALSREDLYEVEYIGISYSLPIAGYYFCSLILMFMMLAGIAAFPYFSDRNVKKQRYIAGSGVRGYMQIISEYFAYTIYQCIFITLILFTAFLIITKKEIVISGVDITDMIDASAFIRKMIPVSVAVCAWQFLIYEFAGSSKNVVSTQFFVLVFVAYFSGLFYPIDFYPIAVQKFSSVSLFGVLMRYMSSALLIEDLGASFFVIGLYVVLLLVFAALIRRKRIGR